MRLAPCTPLLRVSPSSTASRGYTSPIPATHAPHSILTTHSCHTSPLILRQPPTRDPHPQPPTPRGSGPTPTPTPPPSTTYNRYLPVPQSHPPSTSPMIPPTT